jgi:LppP/LprE lipoprotein
MTTRDSDFRAATGEVTSQSRRAGTTSGLPADAGGDRPRARRARGRRLALMLLLGGLALVASPVIATAAAPASTAPRAAAGPGTLGAAMGIVKAHGYTPIDTSGFDADRTLSVIIGMLSGSADGHPQQAFFFNSGRYVGTDTSVASASVAWVWSTDDTVALQYQLYRADDPMCCPTAGAATVRFRWAAGTISALDPVPSPDWETPASRR